MIINDEVRFVLDQHAELDFYSANVTSNCNYTPNTSVMHWCWIRSIYFVWIYLKSCYANRLIERWRFFGLDTISEYWWTGCVSIVESYLMCHDVFDNLLAQFLPYSERQWILIVNVSCSLQEEMLYMYLVYLSDVNISLLTLINGFHFKIL